MGSHTIMIIDDDPEIIQALRMVLESEGYAVSSANDPDEGYAMIERETPDVLILDVMMKNMCDGFDLARKLKSDRRFSALPILMLTAIKNKTGFDFLKSAGDEVWLPVDEYVEKPIAPGDLIAKVKKLLHKAHIKGEE